jgi:HAD superfamily phosphoserine phosphatase-like hydrolase
MPKKLKLLITDHIDETGLSPLKKYFTIDHAIGISEDKLLKIIKKYSCIITRSSTPLPKKIIASASSLKIIGRAAIGVDNIDITAATSNNIAVINAPKGNARVTAEHTVGLIFALLRHIPQAFFDLRQGIWNKKKYVGLKIEGKTLGIVGFGNVGREVYKIAAGIGLKIIVCEPYVRLPDHVGKVTFDELIAKSDIVTFHVPLTYLTKYMINENTISLFKKGGYLINCSRGLVVSEKAVKKALFSGRLAGFAVDVFAKEPPIDVSLLKLPNVIATPHIAGSTVESQRESVQEVVAGIIRFLNNLPPENLVNPQVFRKAKKIIKSLEFDTVIFDCDSTLSAIEGIDELAALIGKKDIVARLTTQAMNGEIPFEEAYEKRLSITRPHLKHMKSVGQLYIDKLIGDAQKVINALQFLGKDIYLVSGGYTASLLQLSEKLGITSSHVFGNELIHDSSGNYLSFIDGPLKRNHGKLQIVRQIPGKKLMVGDGITDLETSEYVELFAGFGGVIRRPHVEKKSDLYIYSKSFAPLLVIAAGLSGCEKLLATKYRPLIGRGLDLVSHPSHVKTERWLKNRLSPLRKLAYL